MLVRSSTLVPELHVALNGRGLPRRSLMPWWDAQ